MELGSIWNTIVLEEKNKNQENLADSEKELFAETDDLIKLDSNIFGGVAVIKNTKGKFENTISSISYKKNDDSEEDTTTRVDALYSVNEVQQWINLQKQKRDENSDVSKIVKKQQK